MRRYTFLKICAILFLLAFFFPFHHKQQKRDFKELYSAAQESLQVIEDMDCGDDHLKDAINDFNEKVANLNVVIDEMNGKDYVDVEPDIKALRKEEKKAIDDKHQCHTINTDEYLKT